MIFADQSGFYLLPMAVRTYAPRGVTPILEETATRDHLSVMAALSSTGQLITLTQEEAFKGPNVVRFLQQLLRQVSGAITLVWDGAPIHRCRAVKEFLAQGAAKRLHLEILPGYSPDLNPTEGLWSFLKRVELPNIACHDRSELRTELRKAIARIRHKRPLLQRLFQLPGLY